MNLDGAKPRPVSTDAGQLLPLPLSGRADEVIIGRLSVLFERPLDLRNFGAVGEKLAIARNAVSIADEI